MASSHDRPMPGGSDRLIRALQRGGMAAMTTTGAWSVYRDRDKRRRVIGTLDGVAVDALRGTGHLAPFGSKSDILVWSGPAIPGAGAAATELEDRPIAAPAPDRTRRVRRSAMEQVMDEMPDETARIRARNAALRFNGDLHRAATPQTMTMRWDPVGAVDGTPRRGTAGFSGSAAAAARRLATVEGLLGNVRMHALLGLVLHGQSMARIAAQGGWPLKRTPKALADTLIDLADAYDQRVAPMR
ncbi:MAG: DUF6456 domain-containing protein [Pseudomonadota bacterium]